MIVRRPMSDLPPLTATTYGQLAAAMSAAWLTSRCRCSACGLPCESLLAYEEGSGQRGDTTLCRVCFDELGAEP